MALTGITDLSKDLQSAITLDEHGTCTVERATVHETLPEGLKPEQFDAAMQHNRDLTEATALAATNVAAEYFGENPDVSTVSVAVDTADCQQSEVIVNTDRGHMDVQASSTTTFENFDEIRNMAAAIALGSEEVEEAVA